MKNHSIHILTLQSENDEIPLLAFSTKKRAEKILDHIISEGLKVAKQLKWPSDEASAGESAEIFMVNRQILAKTTWPYNLKELECCIEKTSTWSLKEKKYIDYYTFDSEELKIRELPLV